MHRVHVPLLDSSSVLNVDGFDRGFLLLLLFIVCGRKKTREPLEFPLKFYCKMILFCCLLLDRCGLNNDTTSNGMCPDYSKTLSKRIFVVGTEMRLERLVAWVQVIERESLVENRKCSDHRILFHADNVQIRMCRQNSESERERYSVEKKKKERRQHHSQFTISHNGDIISHANTWTSHTRSATNNAMLLLKLNQINRHTALSIATPRRKKKKNVKITNGGQIQAPQSNTSIKYTVKWTSLAYSVFIQ